MKAEDKPDEAKVEASSETKSDAVNAEAPTAAITKVERIRRSKPRLETKAY